MTKPFNQELFDDNDPKSRLVMLEFLSKTPLKDLISNPIQFGIDLISKDGKCGIELEHHTFWMGKYMYDYRGRLVDLHIFQRKVPMFIQDVMECSFCAINNEYSSCVVVDKMTVRKYLINKYKEELWCSDGKRGKRLDIVYNIPQKELKILRF